MPSITEIANKYGATYTPISDTSNPYQSIANKYGATLVPAEVPTSNFVVDWLGIKNPNTYISDALSQVSEIFQHPIQAVESAIGAGVKTVGESLNRFGETAQQLSSQETQGIAQRTANLLHFIGATGQVLFSPISAAFSAAEQLPVLKEAADVLQMPFALTGKIGSFAADKFIDVLPISQENKDILKPAFEEVGALSGQILLGGKVMDFISKGIPLTKKIVDTSKREAKQEAIVAKDMATPVEAPTMPKIAPETTIAPKTENISPDLQPLVQEAQKYKSAEEFVKAYGIGEIPSKDSRLLYHVSENPNITELKPQSNGSRGVFVTPGEASRSNGYVYVIDRTKLSEGVLKQDPSQARDFYIDKPIPNEAIIAKSKISQGKIETPIKSQLTDFYNQVTKTPEIPKTAVSGVAKQIEATAIEKGLIDKGYADLAGYDASTIKAQSELGAKYNIDEHLKFVTGEKSLPEGMKPGTPFSIVEDYATKNNDGMLLKELAKSPLASQLSESASQLSLSRIRDNDSPVRAIKEITEIRQKKAESRIKNIVQEKAKIVKEAKIKTFSEFIKTLEC